MTTFFPSMAAWSALPRAAGDFPRPSPAYIYTNPFAIPHLVSPARAIFRTVIAYHTFLVLANHLNIFAVSIFHRPPAAPACWPTLQRPLFSPHSPRPVFSYIPGSESAPIPHSALPPWNYWHIWHFCPSRYKVCNPTCRKACSPPAKGPLSLFQGASSCRWVLCRYSRLRRSDSSWSFPPSRPQSSPLWQIQTTPACSCAPRDGYRSETVRSRRSVPPYSPPSRPSAAPIPWRGWCHSFRWAVYSAHPSCRSLLRRFHGYR